MRPSELQDDDLAKVDAMVRDGKLTAVVLVPPRFTHVPAGESVPLTLIASESPAAGGQHGRWVLRQATARLGGERPPGSAGGDSNVRSRRCARVRFLERSLAIAQAEWQDPDLSVAVQVAGVPSTVQKVAQVSPNRRRA